MYLRRATWLATALCAGCFARGGSAAESTLPSATAESLSDMARAVILQALPETYEKEDGWGETTDAFDGLNFDRVDGRLRISKRKKQVRHGLWKLYRIEPVAPERHLRVRITDLRRGEAPGQLAFSVHLGSRLKLWARVERWRHGVKLLNFTAEGEADVEVRLDCTLAIRGAPSKLLPDIIVEPRITGADVLLRDVDLERISKIDGSLAEELGDNLRHTVENVLQSQSTRIVDKANQAIVKRQDRLRFSPGEWLSKRLPLDLAAGDESGAN